MKKYLAPELELLALYGDVLMASTEIGNNANETAKDYIDDCTIGDINNI